jgi:hypothetical protein
MWLAHTKDKGVKDELPADDLCMGSNDGLQYALQTLRFIMRGTAAGRA